MRGFDICSFLPEICYRVPAPDAIFLTFRRTGHVAATLMYGQRQLLYFCNRPLVLMLSKLRAARTQ